MLVVSTLKGFLFQRNAPLVPEIPKTRPSSCLKRLISMIYDTAWQSLGQKSTERCASSPEGMHTPII